ncbi:DUF3099 domain-containing protein [Timonella sp. A28]|uniref:DUF3099 domain-containing protein n=1 Tax=Timonella sp. A28 TaxID=3442640 RepID=UPI003EBE8181
MPRKSEVPSITTAPQSLADDQSRRTRVYLIEMGIRVACFIGAYFASGTLRWILIGAAVFLPYIAVVSVNASRRNSQDSGNPFEYLQLEGTHTPTTPPPSDTPSDPRT